MSTVWTWQTWLFSGVVRLCLLCSEQTIAPLYIETIYSPKRSAMDKGVSSENVFRQWRKFFYSSRGGGVVIALASRSS
jgi:hypothetical protein